MNTISIRFKLLFVVFVACFGGYVSAAESSKKPNIIVILADDLGYGDVGCYNPESRIPTPNMDRLAREGMLFTDAHSPCTVCTPTRYSLLTGQLAFRVPNGGRVFSGVGGPSLIAPNKLTLPKMLREQGYSTSCVGKWHIGLTFRDNQGTPIHKGDVESAGLIDYSRRIEGGPLDCGFDRFFGTACCPTTDWLYAYIDGDRIPVPPTGLLDKSKLPKHPYANDNRRGLHAPDFDLQEVDLKFLEKSQSFLRQHVLETPDRPFFLFHATQAVHLPSFPGKEFQGKTKSGPHGDFIFEFDHIVGELTKTLRELGLEDNTLVIVTSDNGPEVPTVFHMRKDHQHDGARPWRGLKRDNWEGGHRVPFVVRWPGKVAPGSTCAHVTSLCDIMMTTAEILQVKMPDDAGEDSISMLPMLLNSENQPGRPYLIQQAFTGAKDLAIRRGKWKYLAHKGSGGNNYETNPDLKEFAWTDTAPTAKGQLFDLENDPGETKNLALIHPDIVAELESLLKQSLESGRSRPLVSQSK
jgi:arylsulfatase A-like enzyme